MVKPYTQQQSADAVAAIAAGMDVVEVSKVLVVNSHDHGTPV